jgi:hypothetical protein
MEKLFILQIIAHLLIDFYFQTDNICDKKNKLGFKSKDLYIHSLVIFIAPWLFSLSTNFALYALLIGVSHLLIDGIKYLKKNWKYIFFIDQVAHIATIAIVIFLYNYGTTISLPEWLPEIRYLLMISGLIICLKPTNCLIKEILDTFNIKKDENPDKIEELEKAGRIIGNLERVLTLLFVLLGKYEAIGFLIAAKSIIRFKDSSTAKTEYVLIGTLLSFSVAIIVGVTILKLKTL